MHSDVSRQTHIQREKERETKKEKETKLDHSKIMRPIKRWTNKEKYEWEEEKRQKVIKKREVRANNKNKKSKHEMAKNSVNFKYEISLTGIVKKYQHETEATRTKKLKRRSSLNRYKRKLTHTHILVHIHRASKIACWQKQEGTGDTLHYLHFHSEPYEWTNRMLQTFESVEIICRQLICIFNGSKLFLVR